MLCAGYWVVAMFLQYFPWFSPYCRIHWRYHLFVDDSAWYRPTEMKLFKLSNRISRFKTIDKAIYSNKVMWAPEHLINMNATRFACQKRIKFHKTHPSRPMICWHYGRCCCCCCRCLWFVCCHWLFLFLFLWRCDYLCCGQRLNWPIDVWLFRCSCLFNQFPYNFHPFLDVRLLCRRCCGRKRCYIVAIWLWTGCFRNVCFVVKFGA